MSEKTIDIRKLLAILNPKDEQTSETVKINLILSEDNIYVSENGKLISLITFIDKKHQWKELSGDEE